MLPSLLPSMLPSLLLLVTTTSATVWQRNLDLVKGVSRTQRVEAGTAVEVECELGELPEAAELAWVRLERGWETLLSYWSPGEGVEDLTRGAAGAREGNSWTLTMHRVNTSYAGFYQCQVWPTFNSTTECSSSFLFINCTVHRFHRISMF